MFYYFSERVCPNTNTNKNLLANPNPSPSENTGCPTKKKCNQLAGVELLKTFYTQNPLAKLFFITKQKMRQHTLTRKKTAT